MGRNILVTQNHRINFQTFPKVIEDTTFAADSRRSMTAQKKRENGALYCMRFNMHYHQPRMYSKYQQGNGRPGGKDDTRVQFNTQSNRLSQYKSQEQGERIREEESRGNGFGRGNMSTIPAWLQDRNLRSLFLHQQKNSQYYPPGSDSPSHTPGSDSPSHTSGSDSQLYISGSDR